MSNKRFRLVRLTTEAEFDTIDQVKEHLATFSKYRNDLRRFAVFRATKRGGWTAWFDPGDLQHLIDGSYDTTWDDELWDDDESEEGV